MEKQIIATFSNLNSAHAAISHLKEEIPVIDAQVINRSDYELNDEIESSIDKITSEIYTDMNDISVPSDQVSFERNYGSSTDYDICAEIYTQEGYELEAMELLKDYGAFDVIYS